MRVTVAGTGIRPRVIHARPGQQIYTLHVSGGDAWTVDRWLHSHDGLGLVRKRVET